MWACATCDAVFFREREVDVIGGGGSASRKSLPDEVRVARAPRAQWTSSARRGSWWTAPREREARLSSAPSSWRWSAEKVEGIRLGSVETGDLGSRGRGLFLAIGHDPNSSLSRPARPRRTRLPRDAAGLGGDEHPRRVRGGRRAGPVYRQAVTAAGSGCMAALEAERFLASLEGHPGTALTANR